MHPRQPVIELLAAKRELVDFVRMRLGEQLFLPARANPLR